MFRGRYQHAIDGKGRTSLPSRFREVLAARGDNRLVITTGLDPCLEAYPMEEWLAFEDQLSKMPRFDPAVVKLRRIYVSGAVDCEFDKMGRVLIPANLRQHANLKKDVVWAGMGTKLELWDQNDYEVMRAAAVADPAEHRAMAERLAELGL